MKYSTFIKKVRGCYNKGHIEYLCSCAYYVMMFYIPSISSEKLKAQASEQWSKFEDQISKLIDGKATARSHYLYTYGQHATEKELRKYRLSLLKTLLDQAILAEQMQEEVTRFRKYSERRGK